MAGKKLPCLGPSGAAPRKRRQALPLGPGCGRGTEAKLRLLLPPVPGLTSTQPPPEQQASSPQHGSRTVMESSLQASCTSSPHTPFPRTQPSSHPPPPAPGTQHTWTPPLADLALAPPRSAALNRQPFRWSVPHYQVAHFMFFLTLTANQLFTLVSVPLCS